jgi:hypothetical protein
MSIVQLACFRRPLSSLALVAACALSAGASVAQERITYVRAGEQGAKAYNLADTQAVSVLDIAPATVLAVHAERGDWLNVEAPGGFRVWVWGEYLRSGSDAGTLEVTGADVRMRPLPSSGIESYALEQRLSRGQRVIAIARANPDVPMDRDWVQVWSPAGARAWVRRGDTVALEAGASGTALWAEAVTASVDVRRAQARAIDASSPQAGSDAAGSATPREIQSALQAAETGFATQRRVDESGGAPDYAAVIAAYEAVAALGPTGATADKLSSRLAEVRARQSAYEIRMELEAERDRRLREAQEAGDRIREAGDRDPFFGRFDARGWLVPTYAKGQETPTYLLRWGGEDVAEVVCFSGRYDLAVFSGYELGVNGSQLRAAVEASAGRAWRAPQIDVRRLEVLAGRAARR